MHSLLKYSAFLDKSKHAYDFSYLSLMLVSVVEVIT